MNASKYFWGAIALAFLCRFTAFAWLQPHRNGVETAHHEHASIATNLAAGKGFRFNFFGQIENPSLTSQQAPLVPGLLAGSYLLFGIESESAFLAVLLVQMAASVGTVFLIGRAAKTITANPVVGNCAAGIAAVYPPLVISPLHIQALVWNLFWLALLIYSVTVWQWESTKGGAVLFTTAALGGLHTDPILAAVIAALMLLVLWNRLPSYPLDWNKLYAAWKLPTAVVFAIALGLVPWTLRNYQVHGRLMLIKDSLPYVFWQGNNPASQGTDKLLVDSEAAASLSRVWDPMTANQTAFAIRRQAVSVDSTLPASFIHHLQSLPTEIARMDEFAKRARQDWKLSHYLKLCGLRLKYWLWFDATNPRSYLWHYRVGYLVLVSLATLGVATHRWQTGGCGQAGANGSFGTVSRWLPVILAGLTLTAVHALIITSARFRIPVEMLMVPVAAVGVQAIVEWARQLRPALRQNRCPESVRSALRA